MAKYAQLADIPNEGVEVLESDLLEADNYIDNLLLLKGVDPATVQGNETLKLLAVYYALYRACIREAVHEDNVFLEKAKFYEKLYKEKEAQITKEILGIENSQSILSVELGRA